MYKQRLPAVWGSCAYFLEMDLRRRRVRPTTFWTPSHRLGVLGLHCITAVISLITLGVSLGFFSHQSPQLEMPSVTRWVCMGCHQPNQHGGPTSYFADYIVTTRRPRATTPALRSATNQCEACAQSPLCPGQATVTPAGAVQWVPGHQCALSQVNTI